MSRINWIKGELIGRLGDIVGSRHQGKAYIKTYTPPSNPRTNNQQEIRGIARKLGAITKQLHAPLMSYVPNMRGQDLMSYMIHLNRDMYQGSLGERWEPLDIRLSSGTIQAQEISGAYIDADTKYASWGWDSPESGSSDIVLGVVYDSKLDMLSYAAATRADISIEINIGSWFAQSDHSSIYAYMFFAQTAQIMGKTVGIANSNTTAAQIETINRK